MKRVLGEFEAQIRPQQDSLEVGRTVLDKIYSGDLDGQSAGQMLSMKTATPGSAGYVAIETFTGTLLGKRGSFSLQHMGLMSRGERQLTVVVVPDSASGELRGLCGNMQIQIVAGKHYYDFEFDFAQ